MSQNSNDKSVMLTVIGGINKVDGFDPAPFAVDFTDLATGEVRKRLPVVPQMAWFRLKYPEGKIAVHVTPTGDCFVATARIYPDYKDSPECYLSEATASRGTCPEKPSVSPREWAQTAAIGIALRNAGFGLQFSVAGDDFADLAPDELKMPVGNENQAVPVATETETTPTVPSQEEAAPPRELTSEEKYQQALRFPCPITKYSGKTLGDVLLSDPAALKWVATKFKGDAGVIEAARIICEYAVQQQASA